MAAVKIHPQQLPLRVAFSDGALHHGSGLLAQHPWHIEPRQDLIDRTAGLDPALFHNQQIICQPGDFI